MSKPLTTGELRKMTRQADGSVHIWVKLLRPDAVYAAVTDLVDDLYVVALWCAESEKDWLEESTYGIEWLAYLECPAEDRLITCLNTISVAWKEQFESPNSRGWAADELICLPQLPLVWTVDKGILYLDEVWICPIEAVDIERSWDCWRYVDPYHLEIKLFGGNIIIGFDEDEQGQWSIWNIERNVDEVKNEQTVA